MIDELKCAEQRDHRVADAMQLGYVQTNACRQAQCELFLCSTWLSFKFVDPARQKT